jgi:hypothetical protein
VHRQTPCTARHRAPTDTVHQVRVVDLSFSQIRLEPERYDPIPAELDW